MTSIDLHAHLAKLQPMLAPEGRAWLEATLADRSALGERKRLRTLFAQSARKLRESARHVVVSGEASAAESALDAARVLLLQAALAAMPETEHVSVLEELYRSGEQREQVSILRALAELPAPERFVDLAVHACRTNSLDVFRAIAHDNPYPAAHFPDLHLNQLVLKAIFLGVPVSRVVRLSERAGPELRRMVSEYASERRAAGRPVPDDVSYVIALCDR